MKQIQQFVEWDNDNQTEEQCFNKIARALGVPYRKDTTDNRQRVINAVKRGHNSVLEHASISLDCITNIETYKDFTRHRAGTAYTIESTSFVKYNELEVIMAEPLTIEHAEVLGELEDMYREVLEIKGPKVARDILPQCGSARMYMTANIRSWRYIIGLRGDPNDNPLTIELRNLMWRELSNHMPFFFPEDGTHPMAIPRMYSKQDYSYLNLVV